jgi:hypothetical protein
MPDISLHDQLACARRELRMRTTCYPRWVQDGRMNPDTADHELAAQRAIVETLTALVEQETQAAQMILFGDKPHA